MGLRTFAAALTGGMLLTVVAAAQQQPQQPQQPQEAQPAKIGFVDVERAVATIDEGKARIKELQDWANPKREELEKLGSQVQAIQDQMNAKRGTATDGALETLNKELVAKQRELEDKQRDAKRDFDARQDALLKDLGTKLNKVIAQFGDKNHYTALFILKQNDVAYLAYSADLTEAIIKAYNEQYPYTPKAPAGK